MVLVEGEAVVDAEAVAVRHGEHVEALAVGVVDEHVEDRHAAQRRGVLVDEGDRVALLVLAAEDSAVAGLRDLGRGDQVDGVLVGILVLPELHHPLARGAVAQPRARHDAPAERLGDEVRGDLAMREHGVGEVPEGVLAADRLVDDCHVADRPEEGRVRRGADAAGDDQLAVQRVRLRHHSSGKVWTCPSGSMG